MVDSGNMVLTYFDLYGRAEVSRMILTWGKVEFVDNRISGQAFTDFKASGKCPGGQLPVLENEGLCMNQSEAVARYCAIKAGIYNSANPAACHRDDMIINTATDFGNTAAKDEAGKSI